MDSGDSLSPCCLLGLGKQCFRSALGSVSAYSGEETWRYYIESTNPCNSDKVCSKKVLKDTLGVFSFFLHFFGPGKEPL